MAITSTVTLEGSAAANIPSGFSIPAVTVSGSAPSKEPFSIQVASAANLHASNQSTGLTALLAAVKTDVDTNIIAAVLKLDATATVTADIIVTHLERGDYDGTTKMTETTKYIDGTNKFLVRGYVQWE